MNIYALKSKCFNWQFHFHCDEDSVTLNIFVIFLSEMQEGNLRIYSSGKGFHVSLLSIRKKKPAEHHIFIIGRKDGMLGQIKNWPK